MPAACPKHMVHGPCGGVAADGACELGDRRCAFVDTPTVRWAGPTPAPVVGSTAAERMRRLLATRPVVVADLSVPALDAAALGEVAAALAGVVDAVLVGDSPQQRVQFPPSYRAALLQAAGVPVWAGMHCRDRNRVALEGELAALADLDVAAVHCVTGDHTASGHRPDAAPVFDLDGTRLAALGAAAGHLVSVGESPAAPPAPRRPERLLQKLAAGAEVCFVDHCGGLEPATRFVESARALGARCRFIACVPLVVDADSAAVLASFPASPLPADLAVAVATAADPRGTGVRLAAELSLRLIEAGFDGVDLSGGAGGGDHLEYADAVADVTRRVLRG